MFFQIMIILVMLSGVLSASVIDTLGIRAIVQVCFLVICSVIFCFGLLNSTSQDGHSLFEKRLATFGMILTSMAAFSDAYQGQLNPDGYKFVLIFLLLFVGGNLQRHLPAARIVRAYWWILAIYILATFCVYWFLPTQQLFKDTGPGAIYQRLDVTGSVTLQGILGITYILFTSSMLFERQHWSIRLVYCLSILPALYLVILSASRQAVLVVLVYLTILFFSRNPLRISLFRLKLLGVLMIAVALFFAFSALVSDALYIRLFQNPAEDYTSGRVEAIRFWLNKTAQNGSPLGFGSIGSYSFSDYNILWPHNEVIRFYVEGGVFGIGCVLLFFLYTIVSLRIVLRNQCSQPVKSLVTVFAAIFFVQLFFDNLFHNIYRVSFYYLLLSTASHHALSQRTQASNPSTENPSHFTLIPSRQVFR